MRKLLRIQQAGKSYLRICIAGDDRRVTFLSVREGDAMDRAISHEDSCDLGLTTDLDFEVARGRRQGLRDPTHAALHIAPDASFPVRFSHHMMEEDVGGSRS